MALHGAPAKGPAPRRLSGAAPSLRAGSASVLPLGEVGGPPGVRCYLTLGLVLGGRLLASPRAAGPRANFSKNLFNLI